LDGSDLEMDLIFQLQKINAYLESMEEGVMGGYAVVLFQAVVAKWLLDIQSSI
jgi:hypothetical protein